MSPRTVPLVVGEHTFDVRRKHSWQTYKPWLELNERRTAINAQIGELNQASRELLLPFKDFEDEEGFIKAVDMPEERAEQLADALIISNANRAKVAKLQTEALDVLCEQAAINLGDQADRFFEVIGDWDFDAAGEIVEQVATGTIADDESPQDAAEAKDLPLDGSSPSSDPPVVTPSPVPTGEAVSSPSDSTPTP